MARISQISIMQYPAFYTLSVRKTINFMQGFSEFASDSFDKVLRHLESLHELPSGAPIVCFHNMDLENLDVEIGFPVATLLNGSEEISASTILSQKIVTAIDLGPYENQDPTLEEIFAWIQNNAYEMKGEIFYQYLNDTNRPENEWLTMMMVPIK